MRSATAEQLTAAAMRAESVATPVTTGPEWPTVAEISARLPEVEVLDSQMIPEPLRRWCEDIADSTQVPIDFVGVPAVAALAGVTNRRARMQPKAIDSGWYEVGNLWGAIIGEPGVKKTPTLAAIFSPVTRIEKSRWVEHENARAHYDREVEEYDLRLNAWKQQATAAFKKNYAAPLKPTPPGEQPEPARLMTTDATVEKLHDLLAKNPAGLLVHRDELTGWLASLDREGRESERTFYLTAWSGKEPFTIDRIKRGTVRVESVCVSLFGSIQPARLRSYLVDALEDGPANDGLMQRFQLLTWPDVPKSWSYVDRPPDDDASEQAFEVFRRITLIDHAEPLRFRFGPGAQELFIAWLTEHNLRLRTDSVHPAMTAHLSKYSGLMPKLAMLFQLAETVSGGSRGPEMEVSEKFARLAAIWCEYLESHAWRVYGSMISPQMIAAATLADRIKAKKLGEAFHARDVYQRGWTRLNTPESVRRACEVLTDHGWVREFPETSNGGRPTVRYIINPRVWE